MIAENKDKKGKGVIIIVLIIVAILTLLYFLIGIRGFFKVLKWLIIILFFLAIVGVAVYLVWYFFIKKQKFDVTYVNKQKLLNACHKGYTTILKDLYLSGDEKHSRVFWGKIKGYCRISVLTRAVRMKKDGKTPDTKLNPDTKKEELQFDYGKQEQDVFAVSHRGWLGGLFEEQDLVRVDPKDHDELVGDVTLFGFSLITQSEYWFLNSDLLDVRTIDYAILKEAERGIMFEMLRDSKEIIDKASGLDSGHQKKIEERSMYEIPFNVGGK